MKRFALIIAVIALGNGAFAGPGDLDKGRLDLDQIEKDYLVSLGHENAGVVESALYCIVMLVHNFPEKSFWGLNEAVEELSRTGETPMIRYKANIVSLYLKNSLLMNQIDDEVFKDDTTFWAKMVGNIEILPPGELDAIL